MIILYVLCECLLRDVQLFVVEKTLHLAQRYSEGNNTTSFLLGSIYAKSGTI